MVSTTQPLGPDLICEATEIVRAVLLAMEAEANQHAEACGCRGCEGQAAAMTAWVYDLLRDDAPVAQAAPSASRRRRPEVLHRRRQFLRLLARYPIGGTLANTDALEEGD
jgi:hypothetical protein